MEIFAARLKWLREINGLTQKEMAEQLGVSQPYYGKFEKGTGQPNLETLVMLPRIFQETLDFICGIEMLDHYATKLLYEYFDLRNRTEGGKKVIRDSLELLESTNLEISLERKIDLLIKKKASLDRYDEKLKRVQETLVTYISHLPGMEHIFTAYAEQDYLDMRYREYLEEYQDKDDE